jgi:hypothetical protein
MSVGFMYFRRSKDMNANARIVVATAGIGSDAGGWFIGADGKVHRVPGWNPEALTEMVNAIKVIQAAGQLKTPGLGEQSLKDMHQFVQKEMATHLKAGDVLVVR